MKKKKKKIFVAASPKGSHKKTDILSGNALFGGVNNEDVRIFNGIFKTNFNVHCTVSKLIKIYIHNMKNTAPSIVCDNA